MRKLKPPDYAQILCKPGYISSLRSIQPAAQVGCWPSDDTAGPLARELSGKTSLALERSTNGGFETLGAGGADIWETWIERASTGALASETTIVNPGGSTKSAKFTASASVDTWVSANGIKVTPGETITIEVYTYGDGTHPGRYGIYDASHGTWIQTLVTVGSSAAAWTKCTFTHVIPAGCSLINPYLACPATNGAVCYFDDYSLKGTVNNLVGSYNGSLSFRHPGPRPSTFGVTYPGVTGGAITIGGAAFNSLWNGDKYSSLAWGKVKNAAVWTDLSAMRYLFHVKSSINYTWYSVFGRDQDANNRICWFRRVGAGYAKRVYNFVTPPLGWFCMGHTVDIAGAGTEKCYLYVPGSLAFTKVYEGTISGGNGAWGDHPVLDHNACLFGGSSIAQLWNGDGGPASYWAGINLTDAEMKRAMTGT